MARSFPIQTPDAKADHPKAWPLVVVALSGLVIGVLLVRSTLDPSEDDAAPERREAEPDPAPESEPAHEVEVAERAAAPAPEPVVAPQPEPEAAPEAEPAVAPEPEQAPAPAPRGDRVMRLGRIAYLRCDGAETEGGPYPCPRDRELEAGALEVLEALPACPNAPPGMGEADVRIHFARGAPPEVRLREVGRNRLDGPRVLACVRQPLSALATTIDADLLVVSFRFELR